jgi:hypothetical protein
MNQYQFIDKNIHVYKKNGHHGGSKLWIGSRLYLVPN